MSINTNAAQPLTPAASPQDAGLSAERAPDTLDVANLSEPTLANRVATNSSVELVDALNQPSTPIAEHSAPEKSDRSNTPNSAALPITTDDPLESLKQSALSGNANAQYKLGTKYFWGKGVEVNEVEGLKWYEKAAELGHVKSQSNLGMLYETGNCVEVNNTKAVFWHRKAADQGDRSAMKSLSSFYEEGLVVEKNLPLAAYLEMKGSLESGLETITSYASHQLIEFIPGILKSHSEFKKVKKIVLKGEPSSENVSAIVGFIQSNPRIKILKIYSASTEIIGDQFGALVEALKCNINLILLEFPDAKLSSEMEAQIQALLIRNRDIAELRQYVLDHPPISTVDIPTDVIKILDQKIIVSYLKSGQTKEATRKAIDEFLLIARTTVLAKDSKLN